MALFKISVKSPRSINGTMIEKGMSVEVVSPGSNPLGHDGGKAVREAFVRKYGISTSVASGISISMLDVSKVS